MQELKRSSLWRKRMRHVVVAICLVLGYSHAHALELDAVVGFDGFYTPGEWTPVTVTVDNIPRADKANQKMEPFDGTCIIEGPAVSYYGESGEYVRRLQVPINGRKRTTVYVRLPIVQDINVTLLNKNGRKVADTIASCKGVKRPELLVGLIKTVDIPLSFSGLEGMPSTQTGSLAPEQLPDRWYGYNGLNLLVLPRVTDKLFTAENTQALKNWVAQGGKLLCIGGRNGQSFRGSAISDLLPCEYASTGVYQLDPDGRLNPSTSETVQASMQIDSVKPVAGARTVVERNGIPLLLARNYGAGEVFYLTTDWSHRMMQEFKIQRLLQTYLLTAPSFRSLAWHMQSGLASSSGQDVYGLGRAASLPNMALICAILGSYFVVVGPVNFFLLARRKRLELAWITVPIIVLVYSAGIYGLSTKIKGRRSVFRSYHLVTGRTGSATARVDSVSMLFVPSAGEYGLKAKNPDTAAGPAGAMTPDYNNYGYGPRSGLSSKKVVVTQGPDGMSIPAKSVEQWALDFANYEGITNMGGSVDTDLTWNGDAFEGTITNRTSQRLLRLRLAVGSQVMNVVDTETSQPKITLEPGETVTVSSTAKESKLRPFGTEADERQQPPGTGSEPDLDLAVFHTFGNILQNANQQSRTVPACLLYGEMEKAPVELTVDAPLTQSSNHTFLALATSVRWNGAPDPSTNVTWPTIVPAQANSYEIDQMARMSLDKSPRFFDCQIPGGMASSITFNGTTKVSPPELAPLMEARVLDCTTWEWKDVTLQSDTIQKSENTGGNGPGTFVNRNAEEIVSFQSSSPASTLHPLSGAVLFRLGVKNTKSALNLIRSAYATAPNPVTVQRKYE